MEGPILYGDESLAQQRSPYLDFVRVALKCNVLRLGLPSVVKVCGPSSWQKKRIRSGVRPAAGQIRGSSGQRSV